MTWTFPSAWLHSKQAVSCLQALTSPSPRPLQNQNQWPNHRSLFALFSYSIYFRKHHCKIFSCHFEMQIFLKKRYASFTTQDCLSWGARAIPLKCPPQRRERSTFCGKPGAHISFLGTLLQVKTSPVMNTHESFLFLWVKLISKYGWPPIFPG